MEEWAELRGRIRLWEDDDTLVVDKPPGLSVMGERHDTDLVTMAQDAGERLWWVNRIDKVTSGAVVLARNQAAHAALTRQFAKRSVDKAYLAICRPGGLPARATIDLPLLTAGSGRIRVAAERGSIAFDPASGWSVAPADVLPRKNYPSVTEVHTLWDDDGLAVVLARPVTGRRHQIRVHLAWTGHAIVGDPLFADRSAPAGARTHLHSLRVAFRSVAARPRWTEVQAPPDPAFWAPLAPTAADPADLLARAADIVNDPRGA